MRTTPVSISNLAKPRKPELHASSTSKLARGTRAQQRALRLAPILTDEDRAEIKRAFRINAIRCSAPRLTAAALIRELSEEFAADPKAIQAIGRRRP
jgi:hypothetical protein